MKNNNIRKTILCKIKRIMKGNEEQHYGYCEKLITGSVSKVNGFNMFVTDDQAYKCNFESIISHSKSHEFVYRAFSSMSEIKQDQLLNKFIYINPYDDTLTIVTNQKLLDELSILFNVYDYKNVGESEEEKIKEDCVSIEDNYSEILKTIVGQDEQVKMLLSSLYFNMKLFENKNNLSQFKHNVLIKGGTGTGKTEMIRQLSKILDVPMTVEDATTYTVTGYVGNSVEDMFRQLYIAAERNLERAQRGILVIDEFDKLASTGLENHEVKYLGVQKSLLTVLEGGKIYLAKDNNNPIGGFSFDTSKVTIVALGAFDGIDKIVEKRQKQIGTIGFGSKVQSTDSIDPTCLPKDFIDYGIMSQLIGRFSQIIEMNPLTVSMLSEILTSSKSSPLLFYKEYFKDLKVNLSWSDEFVEYVAKKAYEQNCGARSLKTVVDSIINPYIYSALVGNIDEVVLDEKTFENNESGPKLVMKY